MDATPRTDITVGVRALLPPALWQRLAEADRVVRAPVRFVRDDVLREARGAAQLEGVIRLAPREVANLDASGEESCIRVLQVRAAAARVGARR